MVYRLELAGATVLSFAVQGLPGFVFVTDACPANQPAPLACGPTANLGAVNLPAGGYYVVVEGVGGAAGAFTVTATDPDVAFTVHIGSERVHVAAGADADADMHLRGNAVELLEAFSVRAPFPVEVPVPHAWMVHGLAETFDAPPLG